MSDISKLVLPFSASNSASFSPALFNVNFDFTLWKTKPPVEFEGVGAALSPFRRREAESGRAHTTARKLGALFDRIVPKTPTLIKLYGLRASEISEVVARDAPNRENYGFFAERAGPDATTIWAGATSGSGAIAVHLLACMLARIWDSPPDAISIWEEVTKRRKDAILANFDETDTADLSDLVAAKEEITRAQLAEWDASARAWLRIADQSKLKQQIQLRLVFQDLGQRKLELSEQVYESVIKAWTNSLELFEKLVNGLSQSVKEGGPLLALLSWHLYPDLVIVDPKVANISQNDPLMSRAGTMTIGMEKGIDGDGGLSWSLPLSYLRHYGAPVVRATSTSNAQRLNISEFLLAFLGSFLHGAIDLARDSLRFIRCLDRIHQILQIESMSGLREAKWILHKCNNGSWLGLLFGACKNFLSSSGRDATYAMNLVQLGSRHGKGFLGIPSEPLFGLAAGGEYVELAATEDDMVEMLREVATELPGDATEYFIEVKHKIAGTDIVFSEYATAKPLPQETLKRKHGDSDRNGHCRWLFSGHIDEVADTENTMGYPERLQEMKLFLRSLFPFSRVDLNSPNINHDTDNEDNTDNEGDADDEDDSDDEDDAEDDAEEEDYIEEEVSDASAEFQDARSPNNLPSMRNAIAGTPSMLGLKPRKLPRNAPSTDTMPFKHLLRPYLTPDEASKVLQDFTRRSQRYANDGENIFEQNSFQIENYEEASYIFWWGYSQIAYGRWYFKIYGSDSASLYYAVGKDDVYSMRDKLYSSIPRRFFSFFENGPMDHSSLARKLFRTFNLASYELDPYWKSLLAVSIAADLFKNSPGATVDVKVLQHSLHQLNWMRATSTDNVGSVLDCISPSIGAAFSCLCFCESATFDIRVDQFSDVIAMSSGDSIYISMYLIQDPCEPASSRPIKRVIGNIGRPGIALLVPPQTPLIREPSIHEFPSILHRPFDGEKQDNFRNTSLHLSFTTAEQPVGIEFSGQRDNEIFKIQTLLGVYDRGKWVADLNVRQSMKDRRYLVLNECSKFGHSAATPDDKGICCVDNWAELIAEPESQTFIIRAHENWEARLASSVVCVAKGLRTVVMPKSFCWTCVEERTSPLEHVAVII